MADPESLVSRFQSKIATEHEDREVSIESDRQTRRDEASKLGHDIFRKSENRPRTSTNHPEQLHGSETARWQTYPMTPPESPIEHKDSQKRTSYGYPLPERQSPCVLQLRDNLILLQNEMNENNLRIDWLRKDIQSLRNERRESKTRQEAAIRASNEVQINECKSKIEHLFDVIKQREKEIEELEEKVDDAREQEAKLKIELRKAKSKVVDEPAEQESQEKVLREQLEESKSRADNAVEEARRREEELVHKMKSMENRLLEESIRAREQLGNRLQDAEKKLSEIRKINDSCKKVALKNSPWEFRRVKGSTVMTVSAACKTGKQMMRRA